MIIDRFAKENYRAPTYEDFLSGKGITYFYETLSGKTNLELSSEEILLARGDKYSFQNLFFSLITDYLFASFDMHINASPIDISEE